MALKDERSPKYAFPKAGTSLLKLLLCPQRHGPPGQGNTMALKDEWSPKWTFPGAGTSLLKSPRKRLLYVSRCWLLGAAAAAGAADPSKRRLPARKPHATAAAAVPTKTRPSRTGKHHGPEGRTESKICVSPGRNVPSEIACYTFLEASCCTAAVALTAAASACVCCCLLMPAAACCCLLLPAAACCCLLLPAAACCWCCCWWLLLLL